ncbi:MAG TPA: 5'-3' exonuclease H3TH domain-containing protein, partial [bacterium]|nr:5'-3' exonuclease H3TH domain-containing protein [bacterium]
MSSPNRKLVLLDANGLVYRAFFALPYFTTSNGRPTNAVYGFTNMLLKVLDEEKPVYVAAAFDKAAPTFRHTQFKEYKATRQRMPDDLRPQIQTTKEILEALAIPIFEVEGYEADDILATMARKAAAERFDVLIVTGDLDMLQLVDDTIKVMVTSRGISETTVYDLKTFRARFGFEPARLPDYKGLKGDTTDNIPGVPGVGEKTAGQLIQTAGTVEALLEHVDRAPTKFQEPLRRLRDQILQSKHLATLATDVPIQWSWGELARHAPDQERLRELFASLEFKSLVERVGVVEAAPEGHYRQADDAAEMLSVAQRATEVGLYLVRGDGHPFAARLVGIASSAEPAHALYLPILDDQFPEPLRPLVERPALKVSADAKADLLTLRRFGLRPRGIDFDVVIASYLMNPGRRTHSLGSAAWEYLGWRLRLDADDEEKPEAGLGLGRDEVAEACEAADVLRRLRSLLVDRMKEKQVYDLFTAIEMPLAAVLADMEAAGVAIDVPHLQSLSGEIDRKLADLTAE